MTTKKKTWSKFWGDASLLTRAVSISTVVAVAITFSGVAFGWIEGCFVTPQVNKVRWELLKLYQKDSSDLKQFHDDFIDSCKDLRERTD